MSRLVDEFILMLLFTALSFLLVFYLSQNVRYGSARTYYREAVYQLQKSDYSEEAKNQCYKSDRRRIFVACRSQSWVIYGSTSPY